MEENHMPRVLRTLTITVYVLVFCASATFFLYAHGFPPFARLMTVSELSYSLELWTGIQVRVKGEITSIKFIPEEMQPYNNVLIDPVTDICIGLTWPNGDFSKVPAHKIVTVTGVVTDGQTSGLLGGRNVLFLKAETIEVCYP